MYWWVDGVHFNIRLEEDRLCCLVIVGVRPDGTKELVALADGYRESTESWAEVLRSLQGPGSVRPGAGRRRRGARVLGRLSDVFPATREQRCWVHRTANVVSTPCRSACTATPRRPSPRSTRRRSRAAALEAIKAYADAFAAFAKAAAKITDELDVLLAFYDFPLEHWVHLRTTNPIESTFSTVRLRTKVTRGAGSRKAALGMAYKLLDAAQARWRRITATSSFRWSGRRHLHRRQATRKEVTTHRQTDSETPGPSPPERETSSTTLTMTMSQSPMYPALRGRGPIAGGTYLPARSVPVVSLNPAEPSVRGSPVRRDGGTSSHQSVSRFPA